MKKILSRGKNHIIIASGVGGEDTLLKTVLSIFGDDEMEFKIVDESNIKYPSMMGKFYDAFNLIEGFSKRDDLENCFIINYEKAKEIWKKKIRIKREDAFKKLDIEYMLALESGNKEKQLEIVENKKMLRDLTEKKLPDDLEAIYNEWPDLLGNRIDFW